ncbi:MAG: XrtA system polysaccharide deacetylase [Nitrospiraceae bacterium]
MHCLTFDVEEHFQVSAFESPMRRRHWDQSESRVERNTVKILELLGQRDMRATFFVLGWVAKRHPNLVQRIARSGHEIASHGYSHELITTQTPTQFREDVRRAKQILEDLIGEPVLGYRAPSFTITSETTWAFPIIVEEDYAYDSSVFPIMHDRYGLPGANPWCHRLVTDAGPLWEVPPSTVNVAGIRLPISGGGYFRLYPFRLLHWLLKRVEATGQPLVMYFHPWELDPEQPKMSGPLLSRFRHYVNLHKTEERLVRLLQDFRFGPIREVVGPIAQVQSDRAQVFQCSSMLDPKNGALTKSAVVSKSDTEMPQPGTDFKEKPKVQTHAY